MTRPVPPDAFWITNVSNRNVSLTDLGLTVPAQKSINLLDKRHHFFSKEELLSSASSGSLFKKRDKVVVRKVLPYVEDKQIPEIDFNAAVPSRRRSIVQVEEVRYEELDVSDEKFAEEIADLTDQDYVKK